jgi:DNA-nicking Smr family endonuclease
VDPVKIPIEDVLDLHQFNPRDLPELLTDYLEACRAKGLFSLRIIHGKGRGIQKARVQSLLKRHPAVARLRDAPAEAGGWGATLVELKRT